MDLNATELPPELVASLPPELQAQVPFYYETAQPKIYATIPICLAVAYIGLGLRLYARRMTKQTFGLDDLFAVLGVMFTTISAGLLAFVTHLGVGRHEIVLVLERIEDYEVLDKALIALIAMYPPIIFCIKASALLLYKRLFPSTKLHIICYILLAFTALYTLTCVLVLTISCLPSVPATRQEPVSHFKCSEDYLKSILLVTLVTNVVLDAIILCLPLPLIWRLKANLRRKLQLTLIFTLGSFIFVISIVRVVATKRLTTFDDNWDSTDAELWSIAEAAVGIMTVSLPVMQPVLRKAIYRTDGSCRFTWTAPKTAIADNRSIEPRAILTFGRTGFKSPRGARAREWDVITESIMGTKDTDDVESKVRTQW